MGFFSPEIRYRFHNDKEPNISITLKRHSPEEQSRDQEYWQNALTKHCTENRFLDKPSNSQQGETNHNVSNIAVSNRPLIKAAHSVPQRELWRRGIRRPKIQSQSTPYPSTHQVPVVYGWICSFWGPHQRPYSKEVYFPLVVWGILFVFVKGHR